MNSCSQSGAPSLLDAWIGEKTGLGGVLSPQSLRDWQHRRLKETLAYVKTRSPFYRRTLAHIALDRIRGLEDLARLPLTSAQELRCGGAEFACVSAGEVSRIMSLPTSGTSGPPKRLYFSGNDQELAVDFFSVGILTITHPGDTVRIYLGPVTPGNTVDLFCKGLARRGVKALVGDIPEDPCLPLVDVRYAACDCVVGMPVRILQMAKANPSLTPKSVILCADYIPRTCASMIRSIWGCKVFSHYGATESGLGGAVSCADSDALHIRAADLLFEIVDPETGLPVPDGDEGEIVFTTLSREAMPLVRYRTGDISRILAGPCRCGSVLPRLAPVRGRYANRIPLPEGGEISIHQLDDLLFSLPEVLDYAAELFPGPILRVTVRTGTGPAVNGFAEGIREQLPPGLPVEIRYVSEALPPVPGKRILKNHYSRTLSSG